MNREISFKGKRTTTNEWIEGDSLVHSMYKKGDVCIGVVEGMEIHAVDPSTVCQFTGLCDKNGKKVFEGDILHVVYETDCVPGNVPETWAELYTVVFDNEHHAWFTKLEDGELGEWLYEYDGDCEIIGNIHDKELLGKEG